MKRLVVLGLLLVNAVAAQAPQRRTTNIAALLAHPGFYHFHPVVVVGKLELRNSGEMRLVDDAAGSVRVMFKGSIPDEPAEVRGEFWDLGRMNADDPRLASFDLRATFQIDPDGGWPKPGQVGVIMAGAVAPCCAASRAFGPEPGPVSGPLREPEGDHHRPVRRPESSRRPAGCACDAAATTSWCARLTPRSGWSTSAARPRLRAGARRPDRHGPLGRGERHRPAVARTDAARRDHRQHQADEAPGRDDRRVHDSRAVRRRHPRSCSARRSRAKRTSRHGRTCASSSRATSTRPRSRAGLPSATARRPPG